MSNTNVSHAATHEEPKHEEPKLHGEPANDNAEKHSPEVVEKTVTETSKQLHEVTAPAEHHEEHAEHPAEHPAKHEHHEEHAEHPAEHPAEHHEEHGHKEEKKKGFFSRIFGKMKSSLKEFGQKLKNIWKTGSLSGNGGGQHHEEHGHH